MFRMFIVAIAFFIVAGCVPVVNAPDQTITLPDGAVEHSGLVPDGYVQFCHDFPAKPECVQK